MVNLFTVADLYGLDAQAAQVRARLREGEDVVIIAQVLGDKLEPGEKCIKVTLCVDDGSVHHFEPGLIEDALREALAWLEKRDAEGGR